jgi:hypothetical protein
VTGSFSGHRLRERIFGNQLRTFRAVLLVVGSRMQSDRAFA